MSQCWQGLVLEEILHAHWRAAQGLKTLQGVLDQGNTLGAPGSQERKSSNERVIKYLYSYLVWMKSLKCGILEVSCG